MMYIRGVTVQKYRYYHLLCLVRCHPYLLLLLVHPRLLVLACPVRGPPLLFPRLRLLPRTPGWTRTVMVILMIFFLLMTILSRLNYSLLVIWLVLGIPVELCNLVVKK